MHPRRLSPLLAALALTACGAGPAAVAGPADPSCEPARRLAMSPGEVQPLTPAEAACFLLGPGEYALAGFDAREVASARGGTPAPGAAPRYRIGDATMGGAARTALAAAAAAPEAPPPPHRYAASAVDSDAPFSRGTPWREGERFSVAPLEGAGPVQARVVRIAGRFALAVVERDEAGAGRVIQQAAEALEFLAREGVPRLQSVFSADVPVTSAGSGQLLVIAAAWDPDLGAGATWSAPEGAGAHSYVWLNLNLRPGVRDGYEMYDHTSYRVKVLAHELTHAWQADWARRAAGGGAAGAGWGAEGGADLLAIDLVRSFLGLGAAANWKWKEHLQPQRSSVVLALEPAGTNGRLSRGYYDASSLLRDLRWRLVRAGVPDAVATAEVSRGAVEGWYGEGCGGAPCPGLVARMRARLGAGWTPEGGVLLWALSQAADDRTSNPVLSNPLYHEAAAAGDRYGWNPAGELRSRSGRTAEFGQVPGGSFYVALRVDGAEGVFSASATEAGTEWMLARVR